MSVNIFKNGILSKIAGAVGDAVPLINNFLTNQAGKGAADANTVYVLNNKIDELNNSLTNLFSDYYESEEVNTTTNNYCSLCEITIPPGTYLVGHFGSGVATNPMITPPILSINDVNFGRLSNARPVILEIQSKLTLSTPTSISVMWENLKLYALRIK